MNKNDSTMTANVVAAAQSTVDRLNALASSLQHSCSQVSKPKPKISRNFSDFKSSFRLAQRVADDLAKAYSGLGAIPYGSHDEPFLFKAQQGTIKGNIIFNRDVWLNKVRVTLLDDILERS